MESDTIYERSRKELLRLKKQLSTDSITINFTALDTESKGAIMKALSSSINNRLQSVESVILNTVR